MTGTVHAFRPDTPAGIAAPCMNSRGFTATRDGRRRQPDRHRHPADLFRATRPPAD